MIMGRKDANKDDGDKDDEHKDCGGCNSCSDGGSDGGSDDVMNILSGLIGAANKMMKNKGHTDSQLNELFTETAVRGLREVTLETSPYLASFMSGLSVALAITGLGEDFEPWIHIQLDTWAGFVKQKVDFHVDKAMANAEKVGTDSDIGKMVSSVDFEHVRARMHKEIDEQKENLAKSVSDSFVSYIEEDDEDEEQTVD